MAILRRPVDLDVSERRHDVAIRVPCKKMKKRRELDALVAKSQKSLSAVYNSGGYPAGPHGPLLRNDSDSCTDLEGYPSAASSKHQSTCCQSSRSGMWVPAWLFLIVLIGTIVSATLLWLHIGLKQDFTLLRNHLVKESLRDMEQHLVLMRVNQSQVEQLVGQLSLQLERISKHVELVNGSAEELRLEISDTINKQMPSHFEKFNSSLANLQQQVTRLSNGVLSTSDQLNALTSQQGQIEEAVQLYNESMASIERYVLSGQNTTSSLGQYLHSTIEASLKRADAVLEASVRQAQAEIRSQMSSTLKQSIEQMKRVILTSKTIEAKSVPLTASNTIRPPNNDSSRPVIGTEGANVTVPSLISSKSSAASSATSYDTTQFETSTVPSSQPAVGALGTLT